MPITRIQSIFFKCVKSFSIANFIFHLKNIFKFCVTTLLDFEILGFDLRKYKMMDFQMSKNTFNNFELKKI